MQANANLMLFHRRTAGQARPSPAVTETVKKPATGLLPSSTRPVHRQPAIRAIAATRR